MTSTLTEYKHAVLRGTLRQSKLFAGHPDSDLDALASISVIKPLGRGELLFRRGEPVEGFYLVHTGAIKNRHLTGAGKEQIIRIYRPGESFAEEALLSEKGYATDACALEPTLVLLVKKAGFIELVMRQPELVLCLLRSISQHLSRLVGLLDDLTLKDVKTRVAHWLLRQCPDPRSFAPHAITLPVSKRLLASELGTCAETFSRTLAQFRKLSLLAVDGPIVTLLCPAKLVQLIRGQVANPAESSRRTHRLGEDWSPAGRWVTLEGPTPWLQPPLNLESPDCALAAMS